MLIDTLKKCIEELRDNLHQISEGRSFTDPEVIIHSQALDNLLNEYEKVKRLIEEKTFDI